MADNNGDRKVLELLANSGADLSKPAHTLHYLYFGSIDAARRAADELTAQGYGPVRVAQAPEPSLWKRLTNPKRFSCIAETTAVPTEDAVFATTNSMNALAARLGGEYDGWECSVER